MDYLINEVHQPSGILQFSFITDYCDPVLKVVIDFPKTYWHNMDAGYDPNRNVKLKEAGWKIIEIKSKSPTFDEITDSLAEFVTNY